MKSCWTAVRIQFRWGGGAYAVPQVTSTTGNASIVGNSVRFHGRAITSDGGVVVSEGCVTTCIARFDESKQALIITSHRVPKLLVC